MPRTGYVFTKNNYNDHDIEHYSNLVGRHGIKYICWGKEVGESGTPHLQGYLQTNHHDIRRLHTCMLKAHIEKQRGSSDEAKNYACKDGDWVEFGAYEHIGKPEPGKRNDLNDIKQKIDAGASYETIQEENFSTTALYSKFIKQYIQDRDYKKGLDSLREGFVSASLKPWQKALLEVLEDTVCPRKIYWIWDREGNSGKSWMTNYLAALHGATVMSTGKKADLTYIWANNISKVAIFDLARTSEEYLSSVYSLAEDLKNGRVISTKYESRTVLFPVPHVVCFANFSPDMTKWSQDRYFIKEI